MEKKNTITARQFLNLQLRSNLKNAELAEILGVPQSTITAYRTGRLEVSQAVAKKMEELAKRKKAKDAQKKAAEGHVEQWLRAYSSHFRGGECAFSAAPKYSPINADQDVEENLYLMTDSSASWWTNPYYK